MSKPIPQVSIGMPVYNGEPFIREALDSLLAQTFTDFELIISDNASTDDTEVICQEYAAKDSRIRYVRQKENRGATANFQFVLDKAVGKYFMWAAADDLQKPDFVHRLVHTLDCNPDFVCVMSDVENWDANGNNISISKLDDIRLNIANIDWPVVRRRFFRNPTSNIFFCIYGLFWTQALKKIELNYKGSVKYASASEIPFLAQISLVGPIASISESLKIYRRHPHSIFHQEQKRLETKHRIHGFLNVSNVLFRIIKESSLESKEKISLYYTVGITSARWFIALFMRRLLRPAIRLARRHR